MTTPRVRRPRRWRRAAGAGALVAGLAAGAVVVIVHSDDDGAVPRPLFDEVVQLTPASLPEGWARCGGGPSERSDATDRWWAQTFGPVVDGACQPLVTVTQIPPGDKVRKPKDATNGGIGKEPGRTGAKHWSDPDVGSRGLYTTASGGFQLLVVEGCCGDEATGDAFDHVAEAARDATREQEPGRCTEPHSDLDEESFVTNFFARQHRALDDEGCPVRGDIVGWRTEPPGHHCWPKVTFLTVGDPVGTAFGEDDARTYVRDADGALRSDGELDPRLDLDAALPETAVSTAFHQADQTLWIDESDERFVYAVSEDHVEAWPLDLEGHACA